MIAREECKVAARNGRSAACLLALVFLGSLRCGGVRVDDDPGGADSTGAGGASALYPGFCGGVPCGPGEDCCFIAGTCFDPQRHPEACPAPGGEGSNGEKLCASNSHCGPNGVCSGSPLCLGPGVCMTRSNCGSGSPNCGCNGIAYPSIEAACGAGVRPGPGQSAACGETFATEGPSSQGDVLTPCGTDAQCPTGLHCCAITGQCFDPALPALCAFPPDGTDFPCVDETQCYEFSYCKGPTCGAPGGCASMGVACGGEIAPVCGCNGKSYTNADCAAAAGTVVASEGECPPG